MLIYPIYRRYVESDPDSETPLSMYVQEPTYLRDIIEFILRRKIIPKPVNTVEELIDIHKGSFKTRFPEYTFWYDRYVTQNESLAKKIELSNLLRGMKKVEHRDILLGVTGALSNISENAVSNFISRNMTVETYNMSGIIYNFPGSFDMIFDALKVTDACRIIMYHDNVRGKVLSKVSNLFDETSSEQASEYRKKDKLTKIHRLIVMPFWRIESGTMAFGYVTEKIVMGQRFPNIEFHFEDLRGVQGENIRMEFMKCIYQQDGILASEFSKMDFKVTDLETRLKNISPNFLKALATNLALEGPFTKLIHAEGYMGHDNTKILSIDLVSAEVRAAMIFTAKEDIVVRCKSGFNDILSLAGVLVGMMDTPVKIFGVEIGSEPEYRKPVKSTTEKKTTMKLLDKTVSPNIIREAIFFDPRFNKVCNKRDGEIEWARTVEEADERFGKGNHQVFPSQEDVEKLKDKYEFPDYEEEKIYIKKIYRFDDGDDTEYVLGPRPIPREDKDESYSDNNYAFVLGYYPCVGSRISKDDETKMDYLMDETKIEIPDGRGAYVRREIFDSLSPNVIRKGVTESRHGFLLAAARAAGITTGLERLIEDFTKDVSENTLTYYTLCRPQFTNSSIEEFKETFSFDMFNFIDSRYYINAVSKYIGVNIVVFTYDAPKMDYQPYICYEFPVGSATDNPIDKINLSPEYENRTVILLRRKFKSLADQYDYLAVREGGSDTSLFNTKRAIEFIRDKITLASIRADSVMNRLDVIPEYGMFSQRSVVKFLITDTRGSVSGGVFEREGVQYPVLSTISRAPVLGGAQIKTLSDLLLSPRPSLKTLLEKEPFSKMTINSLGVTKFVNKQYVTSVFYVYMGVGYYVLCKPHKLNEKTEYPLIETPDPYINNVFRTDRKNLSLHIKDTCIMKMVVSLILQAIRLEIMNGRDVKLVLKKDVNNISELDKMVLLKDLYDLNGVLPEKPVSALASSGEMLRRFFVEGGVAAFSDEMFKRLQAQINIFKMTIPTMNVSSYNINLHQMYDIYEDLFSLTVTSDTICLIGMGQYDIWASKALSKTTFGSLQHTLSPELLNDSSSVICVYGARERGLWVAKNGDTGVKISISNTCPDNLPHMVYSKHRKLSITSNSDPTKFIELRKIL